MIKYLYIKNYILIQELSIKPHEAFNVVTGETGAGKSIMLGAIGLLLGKRADRKALLDDKEKCIVEAMIDIDHHDTLKHIFEAQEIDYSPQIIVRREISPNGKSRAFLNDSPVTLETLQKITPRLIDVHSQHDTLDLANPSLQLQIIDSYASNATLLEKYQGVFATYKALKKTYKEILEKSKTQHQELDYNTFLLDELKSHAFQMEEQSPLEESLKVLENAGDVGEKLSLILNLIDQNEGSVITNIKQSLDALSHLMDISQQFEPLHERLESCWIELKDIANDIEVAQQDVELDPEQLRLAQERLNIIYTLQKKHNTDSIEGLLTIQNDLESAISDISNLDDKIIELEKEIEKCYEKLLKVANTLSAKRKKNIPSIQKHLGTLLKEVGMPNAVLEMNLAPQEPTDEGIDKVTYMFSANKGVKPQEIKEVASGGEFSRLMLCLKYILGEKTAMPTIIFDEIDTGISGEIALKVGDMMKEMSLKHQIISISHLHQIAAKANRHFYVYKQDSLTRTYSQMKELTLDERVKEIAQMISGDKPSESALKSAKELLTMVK